MTDQPHRPHIDLPKNWGVRVKSAVLHVISLARFAVLSVRGMDACSNGIPTRSACQIARLKAEINLLREELRIKDVRMSRIPAQRRPHYAPRERLAILEVRAARGWSLRHTANAFLLTAATIASWMQRVDEQGTGALVKLLQPVNRFPEFVRYLVQRLKTLCPALGKVKIAQVLARTGLHLAATSVGRMLKETAQREPPQPAQPSMAKRRVVTAKHPNHLWHVDLTTVPTSVGFWTAWLPFALPQSWPFCWWLAVVMDHYSRRVLGFAVFTSQPTSQAIRSFLGRTIANVTATPKYLVCDKGKQFWCHAFKNWCEQKSIRVRFGAVGQCGSLAVLERFILTLKNECTRRLAFVPFVRPSFRHEVQVFLDWYNQHRPHMSLAGRTPDEMYYNLRPANRQPQFEPRPGWPRPSPCAAPQVLVKGKPGVRLALQVRFLGGRQHLPVVRLHRAA